MRKINTVAITFISLAICVTSNAQTKTIGNGPGYTACADVAQNFVLTAQVKNPALFFEVLNQILQSKKLNTLCYFEVLDEKKENGYTLLLLKFNGNKNNLNTIVSNLKKHTELHIAITVSG